MVSCPVLCPVVIYLACYLALYLAWRKNGENAGFNIAYCGFLSSFCI